MELYDEILSRYQSNQQAWGGSGYALEKLDRHDEAIKSFERADLIDSVDKALKEQVDRDLWDRRSFRDQPHGESFWDEAIKSQPKMQEPQSPSTYHPATFLSPSGSPQASPWC
jgi:tetratricopeptide (TPR) repeat protein